jgi:hypothetical protein
MTQHWVKTKRVKPVLRHLLKSGVSKNHHITPSKAGTTTGKPLPSHWRSTSTTKRNAWFLVIPLSLKTTTPPILVSTMRWRASSKVNTTRLNTPTK